MDITNSTDSQLTFVMMVRVTFRNEGTHVHTPTTFHDLFFDSQEAATEYMSSVPSDHRYCYTSRNALAVKQSSPSQHPVYFPLEKPVIFDRRR
jgi:hypothetical protein